MSILVFTDMQPVHIQMNSSLSSPPEKNPGSAYGHVVTVWVPQMVRDEKKFGNHYILLEYRYVLT